ncbi:MAG: glycoside hydrolase family 2 protein [Prolixibacteraceae bacterium]
MTKSTPIHLEGWEIGFHQVKNGTPENFYKATVPGAVQLDYAKANDWPPFYYAENWKDYLWMEDVYWTYKTSFSKPELKAEEQLFFISKGIDYEFDILLNGEQIFYQEGMFTPVELNLTKRLKDENTLEIKVYPAPKIPGLDLNRSQAAQSTKPAVSYGWDWHPRLVPLGIWDETYLEVKNNSHITGFFTDYKLNDNFSSVDISLHLEGKNLSEKTFEWKLISPEGKTILNQSGTINGENILNAELQNPELWWPHDHGEQPLYSSEISIKDSSGKELDRKSQIVGFRQVRLVMNEGLWQENMPFPKTRNKPPFTMEINGRRIFSKGTNWVNPEIFPGIITRERYDELTDLALEANFNMLRIWGGGIVNKESFYDLCNEKGLLVWTEFPLACNDYEGTPEYLKVLEQESESIIKRIRKHPSNAMWSGGNELFNNWSGMTDQSKALRLLNSQCYLLDPETPFIPTSPIYGVGHGSYVFRGLDGETEVYQWMAEADKTAYTEFGMPGPSPVEILEAIIPEDELFPPEPGTSWESHHAFKAWVGDTWLMKDMLYDYFGEPENLEELVANGQWIQREGYKCIYEEARRQKPWCSMAVNWCYNEPWPTAANNSIINYPAKPKSAFYAVSNSCRPVLASARISKFRWKDGETFKTQLYILNDKYEEIQPGKVNVSIRCGGKTVEIGSWNFEAGQPNTNIEGPEIETTIPDFDAKKMTLLVEVENHPEWNSEYDLLYIGD